MTIGVESHIRIVDSLGVLACTGTEGGFIKATGIASLTRDTYLPIGGDSQVAIGHRYILNGVRRLKRDKGLRVVHEEAASLTVEVP